MMRRPGLVLLFAAAAMLFLGACATQPGSRSAESEAQRPMLDRPADSSSEERAKVHVDLGTAYLEVGRFDVALDEAQAALRHHADYAPAHHLRALVFMYIDDEPAARENFRSALDKAPRDPDFNNSYGWFLCVTGEEREGLERLAMASRNPYYRHPARSHTNAGLCHRRLGELDAAREQFERAAQQDDRNLVALFNLAEIAYEQRDYQTARRYLVYLHQQFEPTPQSVWLGLRTERKLGNEVSEASYAAQLQGRFSDSPQYRLMTQGDFE